MHSARTSSHSNQSFLNHVRLSPANAESRPFQIKDGDILPLLQNRYICIHNLWIWHMDTKYVRKHTITFRHAETVRGIISASASARHSHGRLALTATRTGRQPLPLVLALRSATRCLSHLGFSRECQECLWPRRPILDWQRMDLRGFTWRPNVMPRVCSVRCSRVPIAWHVRVRLASRARSILTSRSYKKLYFYIWGPCIERRDVHCHNYVI